MIWDVTVSAYRVLYNNESLHSSNIEQRRNNPIEQGYSQTTQHIIEGYPRYTKTYEPSVSDLDSTSDIKLGMYANLVNERNISLWGRKPQSDRGSELTTSSRALSCLTTSSVNSVGALGFPGIAPSGFYTQHGPGPFEPS